VTDDQTTTLDSQVTSYVTEVVTSIIVVDVTQTTTQIESRTTLLTEIDTAYSTDTQTLDVTISPTLTQTEDVTSTDTSLTTATATQVNTVDVTDVATVVQTSSTTVTITRPATIYTTITGTVDATNTARVTQTVDVTITKTVSTTTTKTVTATTTQAAPTCNVEKLVNGGFDTGTISPWNPSTSGNGVRRFVAGYNSAYALSLAIVGTTPASSASVVQSFTTVPGKVYRVSLYYYAVSGDATLTCSVSNSQGSSISINTRVNRFNWLPGTFSFPATAASTSLTCRLAGGAPTEILLDTISVVIPC
jgi:hypothetical protein